jgi:predicted dehydrogenase
MKANLGAAVIGLGVGRGHALAYRNDPRTELKLICDIDKARLDQAAAELGGVPTTTRWEDILPRDDIHIVSICTPDDQHFAQAMACLDAGKHIFLEKPMVMDIIQAEQIVRRVEKTGLAFSSNLVLRAVPRYREVKRLAQIGYFGKIFYAEGDYVHPQHAHYRTGWRGQVRHNIVLGGGVHMIDLLTWIIDDRVEEVTCYGNKFCDMGPYRHADCMVALLKFRNGAVAKHLTSIGCIRPHMHQLHIYGRRATFLNQYPDARIYLGDTDKDMVEFKLEAFGSKGRLITRFIDAIEKGIQPPCGIYETADVVAVCEACSESLRQGRPVRVQYPWKELRSQVDPSDPFA